MHETEPPSQDSRPRRPPRRPQAPRRTPGEPSPRAPPRRPPPVPFTFPRQGRLRPFHLNRFCPIIFLERARTKIVYSMYSRKAAEDVKRELMKLQVNYYILEESWCVRRSR